MDKLRAIKFFVRTVELKSFTNVASEMGVAKSYISKEISRLEEDLGARLLQRTTRKLQLTEIGQSYLKYCRNILQQIEDSESFVQNLQSAPAGKLKINASMSMGLTVLKDALADFMITYPNIELDIFFTDESLDMIEHGFDLSFRAASRVFDSSYIGKPLTQFNYAICAAPSYLERHGPITSPDDLKNHNCFEYTYFRGKNIWPIGGNEGIAIHGTLKANNTIFLMNAIKKGLGIGFIPKFVCGQDIKNGDLVELLTEYEHSKLTLYALYPARQYLPPKVSICIDFMKNWFDKNTNAAPSRVLPGSFVSVRQGV